MKHYAACLHQKDCLILQPKQTALYILIFFGYSCAIFIIGYFTGKMYITFINANEYHQSSFKTIHNHVASLINIEKKIKKTGKEKLCYYNFVAAQDAQKMVNRLQKMGIESTIIKRVSKAVNVDTNLAGTIWYQVVSA